MKSDSSLSIRSSEKKIFCQFNSQAMYQIDLDATEPLSQETFSDLISLFEASNKHCIIAVVKSRDPEQLNQFYSFFFNAFQLNKLMFRTKRSAELIGRHDKLNPLPVINPLTNTQIVGEVEYFIVNEKLEHGKGIRASLIGTDYTYVVNQRLRETFKENALKLEDVVFDRFRVDFEIEIERMNGFVGLELPPLNQSHIPIEENKQNLSQIKVPFKKATILGALFFIYLYILITILLIAVQKFISAYNRTLSLFSINELCVIAFLPISCLIIDKYQLSLFIEKEHPPLLHGKIISWVCLGGALGLTFTTNSLLIMLSCSGMLIGFTFFQIIFSLSLYILHYSKKRLI